MSEIRLARIPSKNLLSETANYYAVQLNSADAIFNGSTDITREQCNELANTWAFCRASNDRLYLIASKVGTNGSIKLYTRAYVDTKRILYSNIKAMFCTECGIMLNLGQRHVCNAPRCSVCGEPLSAVDIKNHRNMCPHCRAGYVAKIYSYHHWNENPIFQKPLKRADVLHMGTEWETQFDSDCIDEFVVDISSIANPNPWKQNVRFMHDSTISGVEMITEPKTLKGYIESTELKNALEYAKENGFYTDRHNGAHIHLDRQFFGKKHEICGAMMCYMVGVYWDAFWKPLSRRSVFEWCGKPKAEKDDNIIDIYKKNAQVGNSNHSVAVNCGNYNTIELRFWSGTLEWDEIVARFDISRALATWAKKTPSDNLMACKPNDIYKYIELPETYAYIRRYVTNPDMLVGLPE